MERAEAEPDHIHPSLIFPPSRVPTLLQRRNSNFCFPFSGVAKPKRGGRVEKREKGRKEGSGETAAEESEERSIVKLVEKAAVVRASLAESRDLK